MTRFNIRYDTVLSCSVSTNTSICLSPNILESTPSNPPSQTSPLLTSSPRNSCRSRPAGPRNVASAMPMRPRTLAIVDVTVNEKIWRSPIQVRRSVSPAASGAPDPERISVKKSRPPSKFVAPLVMIVSNATKMVAMERGNLVKMFIVFLFCVHEILFE